MISSFVALTQCDIYSAIYQEQLKGISGTYGTCPFFHTDVLATGMYSHRIMTCHYSFNKTGFQQEFLHFPGSDEFCFDSLSIKGSSFLILAASKIACWPQIDIFHYLKQLILYF